MKSREDRAKENGQWTVDVVPVEGGTGGLTKREYFAGLALQGLLASESENFHYGHMQEKAKRAVQQADWLLIELEKKDE